MAVAVSSHNGDGVWPCPIDRTPRHVGASCWVEPSGDGRCSIAAGERVREMASSSSDVAERSGCGWALESYRDIGTVAVCDAAQTGGLNGRCRQSFQLSGFPLPAFVGVARIGEMGIVNR